MKVYAILACDDNYGIGKNNNIPWKCKEDLEFFKNKTMNNIIIMGRKTFESLNYKPLKNRINIVLTSNNNISSEQGTIHIINNGIEGALNLCKNNPIYQEKTIYIIGGKLLYEECINKNLCDKIYITRIKGDYNCDIKLECIKNINNNYKIINKIILTSEVLVEEWEL